LFWADALNIEIINKIIEYLNLFISSGLHLLYNLFKFLII